MTRGSARGQTPRVETIVAKYLFVYRTQQSATSKPPTEEEMKEMFTQWQNWKNSFKERIMDLGDGLQATGRRLKDGVVTDGPHIEAKEVVGGFSIIEAGSYDEALEVARGCPMTHVPGAEIEIREMAGF